MARRITDECLVCGVCADECEQDAIAPADDTYSVDPDKCDDCGSCEEVCPNDAVAGA